jgi:hypothetical protein
VILPPWLFVMTDTAIFRTGGASFEMKDENQKMVSQLHNIGNLVRWLRVKGRSGRLSRAPLKVLRLELRGDIAACEVLARVADEWDSDLPVRVGQVHASVQALEDAIAIRSAIFKELPAVSAAVLRVFRQSNAGELELVISGTAARGEEVPKHISSLTMRAKLLGFQFYLEGGILSPLPSEEYAMSF